MASGDASSSAAPGEGRAAPPTLGTEAATPTVRPPRAEEVPVSETPQGMTRQEKNNRKRKEQRGTLRPLQLPRHQPQSESLGACPSREMQLRPNEKGKGSGSRPASDPGTGSTASPWNMVNPMMVQSGMYGKGPAAPVPCHIQ
jgi:hypothetical protein